MPLAENPIVLDGSVELSKNDIGGKAWSIAHMAALGIRVPPAFVLPTSTCWAYLNGGMTLSEDSKRALREGIAYLEESLHRTFGLGPSPLLVSVRSGAPVSMPGMMDTVLNLGIDQVVEDKLAVEFADEAFAREVHCRFIESYGRIVLKAEVERTQQSSPKELTEQIANQVDLQVPTDPWEQLFGAVAAVFESWQSPRARTYRRHWSISDELGTAVTIQAMVFGNRDEASGTGVIFSRNPMTGEGAPFGEYLSRGQGEEVVSGERTPQNLSRLAEQIPEVCRELLATASKLEKDARDIQDIEFTVESGTLYFLQSRVAKRSPRAAVKCAVEMAEAGWITREEALSRVSADQVKILLRPYLTEEYLVNAQIVAQGQPSCPGIAQGIGVTGADEAVARVGDGEAVVLLAHNTSPQDLHGMIVSSGICTEVGGSTSHAAVVSRQLGRPCIVGCGNEELSALEGKFITVDGFNGVIYVGVDWLPKAKIDEDPDLSTLLAWAREVAPIKVSTPDVTTNFLDLDLQGITELDQVVSYVDDRRQVRSTLFETLEGIEAAMNIEGIEIVTEQPLVALLMAMEVANKRSSQR
ncbi:pyruvate, phosphate dikinase [Acidithrix ferrooxidans]|uniref:Pyruvate, phosphate dikinase n=1 Tax=Acidithrix ferrooxidans TaxID=1280514 RepID=A0A0D8HNG5_9ACTN|nr:pyruvate, phosphate dikinase [Acidithrix ferrooxidans]KJF18666.1 pyruvate, phosphate dikinase [Acidithrix ferrooxidans]